MPTTSTSFTLWWVSEVGHPPTNEHERYAFEMARKAWGLMPVEFRQQLTAIQQMVTIADTREKRLELSESLIRLGRTVEPEPRPLTDEQLEILRIIEEAGGCLTFTEIRDRLRDRRKKTTTP